MFPWVAVTKCHKLGDSKQQKFIVRQLWRPGVRRQGVGRAVLPETPGRILPHLSQLLRWPSVLAFLGPQRQHFSFCSMSGLGEGPPPPAPPLQPDLTLSNHICKALFQLRSRFKVLGAGTSASLLGRHNIFILFYTNFIKCFYNFNSFVEMSSYGFMKDGFCLRSSVFAGSLPHPFALSTLPCSPPPLVFSRPPQITELSAPNSLLQRGVL